MEEDLRLSRESPWALAQIETGLEGNITVGEGVYFTKGLGSALDAFFSSHETILCMETTGLAATEAPFHKHPPSPVSHLEPPGCSLGPRFVGRRRGSGPSGVSLGLWDVEGLRKARFHLPKQRFGCVT